MIDGAERYDYRGLTRHERGVLMAFSQGVLILDLDEPGWCAMRPSDHAVLFPQPSALRSEHPKQVLHFRDLKHEQRVPLARLVRSAPLSTVNVVIHKPSIPEPQVFQQQRYSLYRYATRLLAERVSWLCRDNRRPGAGDGRVEMVFSNRSAMSYDELRGYLQRLKAEPSDGVRVDWDMIDPELIRAVNHDQLAGLQLVDAVASGLFFSVNKNPYGEVEDRYLSLLSPTLYRNRRQLDGYGLKFWCGDAGEVSRVLAAADAAR